jgi:cytochrome o ubiquinol oxidase operon protein cyoD
MATMNKKMFERTLTTYVIGFAASVVLTLVAYWLVVGRGIPALAGVSSWGVAAFIAILAVVQFVAQLYFFMHLRVQTRPRWRFAVFLFMITVILILVGGSIWIMASLSGRMQMTPDQVNQYMQDQAGI